MLRNRLTLGLATSRRRRRGVLAGGSICAALILAGLVGGCRVEQHGLTPDTPPTAPTGSGVQGTPTAASFDGEASVVVVPRGHTGFQVTGGVDFHTPSSGLSVPVITELDIDAGSDEDGLKWNLSSAEVHAGAGSDYAALSSSSKIAEQIGNFAPPSKHEFQTSDYVNVPASSPDGYWIVVKIVVTNATHTLPQTLYAAEQYDTSTAKHKAKAFTVVSSTPPPWQ